MIVVMSSEVEKSLDNDESRMTNDEGNPNNESGSGLRSELAVFNIRASSLFRHLSFVLCHS
jgi:hypothetical protein